MSEPMLVMPRTKGAVQFGSLLKVLRERSGITGTQMSSKIDMSISYVSMVEHGHRAPTASAAKEMLSQVEEQSRIRWENDIVFITEPTSERELSFEFLEKAGVNETRSSKYKQTIPTILIRDEHIRLECIKAAANAFPRTDPSGLVDIAKRFEKYVKGE